MLKAGDKVRVLSNKYGHGFNIGEVVTITIAHSEFDDFYFSIDNNGFMSWIDGVEVEKLESKYV